MDKIQNNNNMCFNNFNIYIYIYIRSAKRATRVKNEL